MAGLPKRATPNRVDDTPPGDMKQETREFTLRGVEPRKPAAEHFHHDFLQHIAALRFVQGTGRRESENRLLVESIEPFSIRIGRVYCQSRHEAMLCDEDTKKG